MSKQLLIIFVKNPQLGKVKTRLAATIGDEKALSIYYKLTQNIHAATKKLKMDKAVFYSSFIDSEDLWADLNYKKYVQSGNGLGCRMLNAFKIGFEEGYESICLIGSDIYGLNDQTIQQGFATLKNTDVSFGPAEDGGYYLVGMNQVHREIFEGKVWSTDKVLEEAITSTVSLGLTYALLPVLNDIDTEADLQGTNLI